MNIWTVLLLSVLCSTSLFANEDMELASIYESLSRAYATDSDLHRDALLAKAYSEYLHALDGGRKLRFKDIVLTVGKPSENESSIAKKLGRVNSSRESHQILDEVESLILSRTKISVRSFATFCMHQGERFRNQNENRKALRYYFEGIIIQSRYGKHRNPLELHASEALRRMARFDHAIEMCRFARSHYERVMPAGSPESGLTYLQEARIHLTQQDSEQAWNTFLIALGVCSQKPRSPVAKIVRNRVFVACGWPQFDSRPEKILSRLEQVVATQKEFVDDDLLKQMSAKVAIYREAHKSISP